MRKRIAALVVLAAAVAVVTFALLGAGPNARPHTARPHTVLAASACRAPGDSLPADRVRPVDPAVNPACPGRAADAADAAHFDAALATRLGADPGAYARALAARRRLARAPVVPGGRNRWSPAGSGALVANSPAYPLSASDGYGNLSGRVGAFAYDAAHGRVYAAASQGGVWESPDLGATWRSVGQGLPTQIIGALGYTAAGKGTLIAATGDNAFGAYTYGGLGTYWSNDRGRHWHRAAGIPNGALSFKVAVDPARPNVVYVATGLGLYRSADAGRRFANVALPTGRCAGNSLLSDCFLANVVTDVVVQGADRFGHADGAVLAAVGWRAGALPNADGQPQAPANGLYTSPSGLPGSFTRLDPAGFTPQPLIGRVALGIASGPDQNHAYVYAEVQDTKLLNTGKIDGLDIPSLPDPLGLGLDLTKTDTVLNGVYVSGDFGHSWRQMASGLQFELPGNGSTLTGNLGFELLGNYGPGIQAWYNEWILPDPTRQVGGVPTRVLSGLEELFQTSSTTRPANGGESFTALTPYNGNKAPDCVLQLLQTLICDQLPQQTVSAVHPDQHAGLFIPGADGGVTLLIGNDGGVYRQQVPAGGEFTAAGFGAGAQAGLQTLEAYGAAIAGDGTIYAGLQDNGNLKVVPGGSQFETLGGDGIFTAVNPSNSKIAYDTLPDGTIFSTTDGGKTWRDASPGGLANPPFYTPLGMDPLNPDHLMTGGRQVLDSLSGPKTAQSSNGVTIDAATDWQTVFDLGTRKSPGDPNAAGSKPDDLENQVSALAVRGPAEYVGYCGSCDPVKDQALFGSGIATNVGGKAPPKAGASDGWHIAAAAGLPHRIITSVAIDPADPRHVFVTLGSSTLRPYVPPGRLGNDGVSVTAGSVYESLDAGQSFHDVSGNLPSVGGAWVAFHRRQLVVANTVGVFASTRNVSLAHASRLRYGLLGRGLPTVSVFSLAFSPTNPDEIVAATFGRGLWKYVFSRK